MASIQMGLDTRNKIINSLWITAGSVLLAHRRANGLGGIGMIGSPPRR